MARKGRGSKQPRKGTGSLPQILPCATEFSDDRPLEDPVWILRTLKQFPDILDDLIADTDLASRVGRNRADGDWALVMLAMVMSEHVDVETFWDKNQSSTIWSEAGFKQVPSYQTAWLRLTELESVADAFTAAANKLIRRAVGHEPQIAKNVWMDATGFETNAILEHCCDDRTACKKAGGAPAKFIERAGDELIKEERHRAAEEPAQAGVRDPEGLEPVPENQAPNEKAPRRRRPYRYFWLGPTGKKHLYRTLDPDAGARVYGRRPRSRKRFWLGGLEQAVVSFYVGAPLALNLFPADHQEHAHYQETFDKLLTATGGVAPGAVAGDRGLSVSHVFEFNTRQGIASVFPWRQSTHRSKREDMDTDRYDRHGIPRCQYCGGPGDIESKGLGLYFARGNPRLRFRCQLRITSDCGKRQSIACSEEWRLLVPLSRRLEAYHALDDRSKNFERVFLHWRRRYSVACNNVNTRPKRAGIAWQNLRAQAALLIEWFRLCLRHGWIGSHSRRNYAAAVLQRAEERLRRVLGSRRKHGLDLPRGAVAEALRLASASGAGPPTP